MGKRDKQIKRLLGIPNDFSFDELESLLIGLGFELSNAGGTSGSAVRFINRETKHAIRIHRPHPSPTLKQYQIKIIIKELKLGGYLNV